MKGAGMQTKMLNNRKLGIAYADDVLLIRSKTT